MAGFKVLAIDDDPIQLQIIATAVRKLEYPPIEFLTAQTAQEAIAAVQRMQPDLVICDKRLPDGDAADVLAVSRAHNPFVPFIVITAHESVEDAVQLLKTGARDYLTKPLNGESIQQLIVGTLSWHGREEELRSLAKPVATDPPVTESNSEAMKAAISMAIRAAPTETSILIEGESGTGKEVLARTIHENSGRSAGPFTAVHVAALPESLIESELFGHAKGSFTGATSDRVGFFERAAGGTLFIDELGEIPMHIQVKLLRAIQFREVQRVGETKSRALDVRIIAATNRSLADEVKEGHFREDLYYRLAVINVQLPPLRERREDIPRLAETLLKRLAERSGLPHRELSNGAMNALIGYDFPGNVRELENILERSVVLAQREFIVEEDLPTFVRATDPSRAEILAEGTLDAQLNALERTLILEALEETKGHQSHAAERLGISERRLRSRLDKLDIQNPYT